MARTVRMLPWAMRLLCVVLGASLLALSGCGVGESLSPAPPPLLPARPPAPPAEIGPYGIGVSTMDIDDGQGSGRTLPVEIWYPATTAERDPTAHYLLEAGALVLADLRSPRHAVRDAPLDLHGAPHPVVVFSHGFGGTRLQSVYLTEQLASHGFVVAAPDHVGNTFLDQIDAANAMAAIDSARVRPRDLSATLDVLLERAAGWPDDPLAFAADSARVGVAGHSFGGFTVFRIAGASIDVSRGEVLCAADPDQLFCDGWPGEEPFPASARDERFIAALPQAPGAAAAIEESGFADVAVPTMIQSGLADRTTPFAGEAAMPYAALPSPAYLLAIEGAGHFTFSDMCELLDMVGLSVEQFDDGCSDDNVSAAEAHAVIAAYATAFFQVFVAGDDRYRPFLSDADLPSGDWLQGK